jgi:hypothetical protein
LKIKANNENLSRFSMILGYFFKKGIHIAFKF